LLRNTLPKNRIFSSCFIFAYPTFFTLNEKISIQKDDFESRSINSNSSAKIPKNPENTASVRRISPERRTNTRSAFIRKPI
jgi:hypothetical protein